MSRKKPIKIKVRDTIEVWEKGVFEGKVVASGNGAAIPFYKKFIGEEVVIILRDKIKESENLISTDKNVAEKMGQKYYKNSY